MSLIIGVTGKAQHGKDSVAQHLVKNYGFKRYAFADQLKSMALALDPIIGYADRLSYRVEEFGWEAAKQDSEVRRFLQVLGTEGVREHISQDAWIDALGTKMERDGFWEPYPAKNKAVLSDVRFNNEAEFVQDSDGLVLRVVRLGYEDNTPAHASEDGIREVFINHTIEAYDLDGLHQGVDEWMKSVLL